jgi:hypothetical protein
LATRFALGSQPICRLPVTDPCGRLSCFRVRLFGIQKWAVGVSRGTPFVEARELRPDLPGAWPTHRF